MLSELNSLARLQQTGELSEITGACKPSALPAETSCRGELTVPRTTARDQRRAEGPAAALSVRLPSDVGKYHEATENREYNYAEEETETYEIYEFSEEAARKASGECVVEATDHQQDIAEVDGTTPEEQLSHQAIVASMTGNSLQEPGSFLTCLSPLSPIREVAEGGCTPKATAETREVLEMQDTRQHSERHSKDAIRGSVPRGQLDFQNEDEAISEDAGQAESSDPLAQLPSSKERYLQLRNRFLGKS